MYLRKYPVITWSAFWHSELSVADRQFSTNRLRWKLYCSNFLLISASQQHMGSTLGKVHSFVLRVLMQNHTQQMSDM